MVTLDEIKKLSLEERINLVESIWDSIAEETTPAELKISQEEKEEIQRRYADFKKGQSKDIYLGGSEVLCLRTLSLPFNSLRFRVKM
jgi:putative addiction module component (TIGR02574 family)